MRRRSLLAVVLVVGLAVFMLSSGTPAQAQSKAVELKLWSAWTAASDPMRPALQLLQDMIKEKGKPVNVSVKFVGGPEVFGPFQGTETLQKGTIDIAYTAGAYGTGVIPEVDALKCVETTPWEERKNGTFDLWNKWHREKGLEWVARAGQGQGFQGYLAKKKITKPDLKGLTMRVVPIYVPLINALGAKGVNTAGGEVYTALERGTVDGFWWGSRDIKSLSWNEVCKYIWGPSFWECDCYIMMNKAKWDSLDPAQKKAMVAMFEEYEKKVNDAHVALQSSITKELLGAGMEEIKFSPEDEKWYLDMAYREGWKAAIEKSKRVEELKKLTAKRAN